MNDCTVTRKIVSKSMTKLTNAMYFCISAYVFPIIYS